MEETLREDPTDAAGPAALDSVPQLPANTVQLTAGGAGWGARPLGGRFLVAVLPAPMMGTRTPFVLLSGEAFPADMISGRQLCPGFVQCLDGPKG